MRERPNRTDPTLHLERRYGWDYQGGPVRVFFHAVGTFTTPLVLAPTALSSTSRTQTRQENHSDESPACVQSMIDFASEFIQLGKGFPLSIHYALRSFIVKVFVYISDGLMVNLRGDGLDFRLIPVTG